MSDLRPLPEQLQQDYIDIKGVHGDFLLGSTGMFVIHGLEEMRFLTKSCPRPILSNTDPAPIVTGSGVEVGVPGQVKNLYTGNVVFIETEAGAVNKFAEYIANTGGMVNADFYVGRPDNYTDAHEMIDVIITFESADWDTDNRSEGTTISASITYHYFGSSAKIGVNATTPIGKKSSGGVAGLVNRIDNAMSKVRKGANAVSSVANGVGALGSLFG